MKQIKRIVPYLHNAHVKEFKKAGGKILRDRGQSTALPPARPGERYWTWDRDHLPFVPHRRIS
jgi:hypothetical protein